MDAILNEKFDSYIFLDKNHNIISDSDLFIIKIEDIWLNTQVLGWLAGRIRLYIKEDRENKNLRNLQKIVKTQLKVLKGDKPRSKGKIYGDNLLLVVKRKLYLYEKNYHIETMEYTNPAVIGSRNKHMKAFKRAFWIVFRKANKLKTIEEKIVYFNSLHDDPDIILKFPKLNINILINFLQGIPLSVSAPEFKQLLSEVMFSLKKKSLTANHAKPESERGIK